MKWTLHFKLCKLVVLRVVWGEWLSNSFNFWSLDPFEGTPHNEKVSSPNAASTFLPSGENDNPDTPFFFSEPRTVPRSQTT